MRRNNRWVELLPLGLIPPGSDRGYETETDVSQVQYVKRMISAVLGGRALGQFWHAGFLRLGCSTTTGLYRTLANTLSAGCKEHIVKAKSPLDCSACARPLWFVGQLVRFGEAGCTLRNRCQATSDAEGRSQFAPQGRAHWRIPGFKGPE